MNHTFSFGDFQWPFRIYSEIVIIVTGIVFLFNNSNNNNSKNCKSNFYYHPDKCALWKKNLLCYGQ